MENRLQYDYLELGPGQGTLISDIFRTLKQHARTAHIGSVNLLECNPTFRELQARIAAEYGYTAYFVEAPKALQKRSDGLIIVANEFFDALPIHKFCYDRVTKQWHELLVDFDGEFQMRKSGRLTVNSALFFREQVFNTEQGLLELSPQSWKMAHDLAQLGIKYQHCIGIIVDYGQFGPISDSLKAIKNHQILNSIFEHVGESDITADVDFKAISFYFQKFHNVRFVTQRQFLLANALLERLKELQGSNPGLANELSRGAEFLTDENRMGKSFKVLTFEKPIHLK